MLYAWVILASFCGFAFGDVMITFDATSKVLPAEDPVGAVSELLQDSILNGSCDMFEMLGASVEEHIDGLLKIMDRFGLILGTEEVELIRGIGCKKAVEVAVADS